LSEHVQLKTGHHSYSTARADWDKNRRKAVLFCDSFPGQQRWFGSVHFHHIIKIQWATIDYVAVANITNPEPWPQHCCKRKRSSM